MSQYINISAEEMDQFLTAQGFMKLPAIPGTYEAVYGKRVDQGNKRLTLRVYTGISGQDSRGVGEDAIRVNLFMRKDDGNIVKLGGSKRVHRVLGWKKNLQSRIDGWLEYMPKDNCPRCGNPLVPRKGKKGKFLGCSGYPVCKFTRNIET